MRKQIYTVKEEKKLLDYLIETMGYKRSGAKSLLMHKDIYINDECINKYDYQLQLNDKLEIKKQASLDLEIIYEDDDFIAINKPAGLLSISTEKEKQVTAYHMVREYLNSKHEKVFILHRLDRDTSGVLVFVKSEKLKERLQDKWNEIVKNRGYYAIVEGRVLEPKKRIVNYLKENRAGIVYSCDKDKYSKEAITEYELIKNTKNLSLLDVHIYTGRKNQIRVSLSDLNHPVIGDEKYGKKKSPLYRLGLHAYELSFYNPVNKKEYSFKTDMPNSFKELFSVE